MTDRGAAFSVRDILLSDNAVVSAHKASDADDAVSVISSDCIFCTVSVDVLVRVLVTVFPIRI